MNDDDPIRTYVVQFARRLPGYRLAGNRVLEEIECHLRELADALYRQGLEPTAAAREAIQRFGTPDEVLRQFDLQAPLESEVTVVIRYLLKPMAWLALVLGALVMVMTWLDDAPLAVAVIKTLVAAAVIGCGLTVLHQARATQPKSDRQRVIMLAGALILLVIGSAGAVWTALLGITTGDWEYYGFGICGLLMMLGVLSTAQLTVEPIFDWPHRIILTGALISLALGSAIAMWMTHLAITSGDWQYLGFAGSGLLMLLGVSSALWAVILPRRQSIAP